MKFDWKLECPLHVPKKNINQHTSLYVAYSPYDNSYYDESKPLMKTRSQAKFVLQE